MASMSQEQTKRDRRIAQAYLSGMMSPKKIAAWQRCDASRVYRTLDAFGIKRTRRPARRKKTA